MPERETNTSWTIALQLLGATAGLAALANLVGGSMLWLRFNELGLAADQAVAVLPQRLLVSVGVHTLAAPVVLGFVVALFMLFLDPLDDKKQTPRKRFYAALIGICGLGLWAVAWRVAGLDVFPEQAAACASVVVAALVIATTARNPRLRGRHIAAALFASFSLVGGVLGIVRTTGSPKMEPAAIMLENGKTAAGFFVAQTAEHVYVAPLPGDGSASYAFADADVDSIVAIPRAEVTRLVLRAPAGVRIEDAGRDQARRLVAELIAREPAAKPKPTKRADVFAGSPVATFAPLVHLSVDERLWPMSPDAFLRSSRLLWVHGFGKDCDEFDVGRDRHVARPRDVAFGAFDPARIGVRSTRPYVHPPADKNCKEQQARAVRASAWTRPYDKKRELPAREGFVLDLDDKEQGGRRRLGLRGSQTIYDPAEPGPPQVPVIHERHKERYRGRDAIRITYWLFYGLSKPPGPDRITERLVHEGDWERVSVLVLPEGNRRYRPISVRFHIHDYERDVPWPDVELAAPQAGDLAPASHPVAYVARGSHATHPRAGSYEEVLRVKDRRRLAVYDTAIACPRCPQWETWHKLVDATSRPWNGFGGAWGNIGSFGGATGPTGPSHRKTVGGESPSPEDSVSDEPNTLEYDK